MVFVPPLGRNSVSAKPTISSQNNQVTQNLYKLIASMFSLYKTPVEVNDKVAFVPAPYFSVPDSENVFINNARIGTSIRLWKYMYDYDVSMPRLEVIPDKLHSKGDLPLFRIFRFSDLSNAVANNKLTFISPEKWEDPFEKLIFRQTVKTEDQNVYSVACLCMSYDRIENEEAAWNRSGSDISSVVRVEFSFNKLVKELAKQKDYEFYFSVVDYSLPRRDIISVSRYYQNNGFSNIHEYLNALSLKRKAFAYENEIRLFIVKKNAEEPLRDFESIDCDMKSVINKVCTPPKRSCADEAALVKAGISQKKIQRSHLYDTE